MIDRVLQVIADRSVTAVKCATLSEDIYADHFYGNPVMPGAMQIESMAQAATILLELSSKLTRKAILVLVNNVKFRNIVRPGDQMEVEMTQISTDDAIVQLDGIIRVSGKVVTNGRLTFSLQPIDNFYPPSMKSMTKVMYQNFLRGAKLEGVEWAEDYDA
ncbi:MAG: beta-hydroxyacyl-ACP dehydratase [candidate division Zixibacteria bacterium]|nr:beta-hydroxyacyl-ACP dehydratase [candidate division Zixibacteria bacterium]